MAIISKIIVRSGLLTGSEKDLNRDLLRIGRDPANDFVVDDIEVSRNHAKISRIDDHFKIEDLNSTNGTFINGKQITMPVKLNNGDLISLGEGIVFEFYSKNERPGFFSGMKTNIESKSLEKVDSPESGRTNFVQGLSKLPTWATVLLIALGFIILFCIIPLIFVEITNQWCNLFSGFFNAFSPGVCP
jgi:pSer/pThr/pTyr-binding forkhead associated (FHA) protein